MTTRLAPPEWDAAWAAALEAMELEVDQVERLLRSRPVEPEELTALPGEPFQPPAGLGPLPLGLAERARRLLQRQFDLSAELTSAVYRNRQHVMLATRMRQAPREPRPVFIDRAG